MMGDAKPYWIGKYGPEFCRKTYGRIWVRNESDRDAVLSIIREIDETEFECYMPKDFVEIMPEDMSKAQLAYGHKFELRTDLLELECWKRGIKIWVVTGCQQ